MNKKIYLAGGCFWGTEAYFSRLKGVCHTTCGYANGHTPDPTYHDVCTKETGYAEAVLLAYDSNLIDLSKLLTEFFKTVNPTTRNRQGNDIGSQYRSGIYYVDPEDEEKIKQFINLKQGEYHRPIVTEVLPLTSFYPAEEYHQQYLLRNPNGYCHVNLNLIAEEDMK